MPEVNNTSFEKSPPGFWKDPNLGGVIPPTPLDFDAKNLKISAWGRPYFLKFSPAAG